MIPSMAEALPLADFTRAIADDLAGRLTESGLYAKEARAMVNTWTASYFQADGIRALFVLPQSWTDAFIPMTVSPQPKKIVRVMVGRLELLTADRERLAEDAVHDLASAESTDATGRFRVSPRARALRRADRAPGDEDDDRRDRCARSAGGCF